MFVVMHISYYFIIQAQSCLRTLYLNGGKWTIWGQSLRKLLFSSNDWIFLSNVFLWSNFFIILFGVYYSKYVTFILTFKVPDGSNLLFSKMKTPNSFLLLQWVRTGCHFTGFPPRFYFLTIKNKNKFTNLKMGHTSEKAPEQQTNNVNKSCGMITWQNGDERQKIKNSADDLFRDYPLSPWLIKQRRHWVSLLTIFWNEKWKEGVMFTYFEYD